MSVIRILLVEDHFLARTALISIVSRREEMEIVAIAENGADAITQYFKCRPDVTIMDLGLPGTSGLEAIRAIRNGDPGAHILVLTNYDGSEDIFQALRAGAIGYLVKDTSRAELLDAIHATYRGARYIPEELRNRLAQRATGSDLTPRELEVLALLTHGGNNKDIAKQLRIAEKTTSIHVSNILSKLGVSDRTQAAIAAVQRGLVHLD
jgi:DNA-binding NarL/FixJ family response regulator